MSNQPKILTRTINPDVAAKRQGGITRGNERNGALQRQKREGLTEDPSPEGTRARGGGSGGCGQ